MRQQESRRAAAALTAFPPLPGFLSAATDAVAYVFMVQGSSIPSKDNNGIIAQNCGRHHREILMCVNRNKRRGKAKQGGGNFPAAFSFSWLAKHILAP